MNKFMILFLAALVASASALPSESRFRRSYAAAPVAYPAPVAVPALAAVPTLTAVHSQRLIPQPPAVHQVASPTTVLQTVQTGTAVVGHAKVGDAVVGRTPDVNGYAFRSDVRHDAPLYAPAPAIAVAAPIVAPAPLPVPIVAAPAPVPVYGPAPVLAGPVLAHPAPLLAAPGPLLAHPAPLLAHPVPAAVSSYSIETGHTIAHDTVVTSPVIQNTLHAPVIGAAPIVAPVAVPAPLALPAYKKA